MKAEVHSNKRRRFISLVRSWPVLVAAVAYAGDAAAGAEASFYLEVVSLDFGSPTTVTSTPHAAPAVYKHYLLDPHMGFDSTVVLSSGPAPFVQAITSAYNWSGETRARAVGGMYYEIVVHGPPESQMPLAFSGSYLLSGNDLTYNSSSYTPINWAGVVFSVGTTFLNYYCGNVNYQCVNTQSAAITTHETSFTVNGEAGWFNGNVSIATDAQGFGRTTVHLGAEAGSSIVFGGSSLPGQANAFIDPEFHIDPAWLAANPTATFSLTPGVGNAMLPVPEPSGAWLMLGGLGALGMRVRRRRH